MVFLDKATDRVTHGVKNADGQTPPRRSDSESPAGDVLGNAWRRVHNCCGESPPQIPHSKRPFRATWQTSWQQNRAAARLCSWGAELAGSAKVWNVERPLAVRKWNDFDCYRDYNTGCFHLPRNWPPLLLIQALRRQRQEVHESKASLGYTAHLRTSGDRERPCHKPLWGSTSVITARSPSDRQLTERASRSPALRLTNCMPLSTSVLGVGHFFFLDGIWVTN